MKKQLKEGLERFLKFRYLQRIKCVLYYSQVTKRALKWVMLQRALKWVMMKKKLIERLALFLF
jgi:hypothetical protein